MLCVCVLTLRIKKFFQAEGRLIYPIILAHAVKSKVLWLRPLA